MVKRPSVAQAVEAYLNSVRGDKLAGFTEGGRSHRGLSRDQLEERWAAAYRTMTWHWNDDAKRQTVDDYSQELELRGIEPPWDQVKAELERFTTAVSQEIAAVRRKSPSADGETAAQFAHVVTAPVT